MVEEYLIKIKEKKYDLHDFLQNCHWNHPHRLAEISLSGSLTMIEDRRYFTGAGTSASVITETITGSLFPVLTRKFYENEPFYTSGPPPGGGKGEFTISHKYLYAWRMFTGGGILNDLAVVGTRTSQGYTRTTTSDPWVAGSSSSFDLMGSFGAGPVSGTGGDIISGGRGPDIDTSKATLGFSLSGDSSAGPFGYFYRFPWDYTWASEVDIFTDFLDDWIANGNATYGGGFSGSCSLSLDFS